MKAIRNAVLGGLAAVFVAGAGTAETLTEALVTAYENSNLLDKNRATLRATDEDVAQAVSLLRPVLNFVASASDTDVSAYQGSLSLTAGLTLYEGGRNRLGVEAAKENVLATRAALVTVEQDVLFDAVSAYMDMRAEAQSVRLAENSLRLTREELRAAEDRFEVGEVTRTDVSLAESRVAEARSRLVAAQGALEVARARYFLAIGAYPANLQAPPPAPEIPATLEAAKALANQNHPAIKQVQHLVKAAEINVERARAAKLPRVELGASLSRNRSVTQGTPSYGDVARGELSVTVPIYQGGRLDSAQRQAMANAESVRAELLQTSLTIEDAVARAWAQLEVARASITARQQQIRAAELAFEGVREEAKLGARTTLDVLDAEQELLTARNDLVQARRDEYVAVYALLSAMGLLTTDHLGLEVAGYDPAAYYNAVKNAPVQSIQGKRLDRVLERSGRN
ncbi:TolC family outer membrane protein [Rhodovulum sp. YNF3179]|uniref:TolC family outer membrane protein n=1 Tax=Rhodovulum sp. YNF3179 TaxID=3425127 RepID=UPI003D3558BE